ncbi:MAG TPA: hypothetical protein VMR44_10350 [Thermoanaerobaculia bacterium]|nr:hypothetical protein [Thermoanaerobaculia bacterium]
MDPIDHLLARLAEVRAAQPDPGDIGAPNERERVAERNGLLDRFRTSITARRRRVEETAEKVVALKVELARWAKVEARMELELTAAEERVAAMPNSVQGRERRQVEGGVTALAQQVAWARDGLPRDGGVIVSCEPFDSAFRASFGVLPHESAAQPAPELRARLDMLEPGLLTAQADLDRELASLDQVLAELAQQAA